MSRKVLLGVAAAAVLSVAQLPAAFAGEMETLTERVSYVLGYNIGQNFKRDQVDIDIDTFSRALQDAAAGKEPVMTQEEMQTAMRSLQQLMQAKHAEFIKVAGEKNKQEGEAFLLANGKKKGIVTTESGLQYKVLTKGVGAKPSATSQVTVHYRGTLLDGTEFDSSYSRGQPATFGVNQVIPGWTEALQLMPEGSKWEVYIPSDLAYGAGGGGGDIGPNSTLVFEIELLSADATKAAAQ